MRRKLLRGVGTLLVAATVTGCFTDASRTSPVEPRVGESKRTTFATVTPEVYGAFGDGKHDDTAALQRALDAASGSGDELILGNGATYLISDPLRIGSGTRVRGYGTNSVLQFTWARRSDGSGAYYIGNRRQVAPGDTDIHLSDFSIRGAGDGLPSGPIYSGPIPFPLGIRLRHVSHFSLTGLTISHVPGASILYQGCSDGEISDNDIKNSGRDGITGTGWTRGLNRIRIANNRIELVGDDAIAIVSASVRHEVVGPLPTEIVISQNYIEGWPGNPNGLALGRGINVNAATHVRIVENIIVRTHSYGILVKDAPNSQSIDPETGNPWRSDHILIADNVVREAGQNVLGSAQIVQEPGHDGIAIRGGDQVSIRNNAVTDSYGQDIVLYDCYDCSVD